MEFSTEEEFPSGSTLRFDYAKEGMNFISARQMWQQTWNGEAWFDPELPGTVTRRGDPGADGKRGPVVSNSLVCSIGGCSMRVKFRGVSRDTSYFEHVDDSKPRDADIDSSDHSPIRDKPGKRQRVESRDGDSPRKKKKKKSRTRTRVAHSSDQTSRVHRLATAARDLASRDADGSIGWRFHQNTPTAKCCTIGMRSVTPPMWETGVVLAPPEASASILPDLAEWGITRYPDAIVMRDGSVVGLVYLEGGWPGTSSRGPVLHSSWDPIVQAGHRDGCPNVWVWEDSPVGEYRCLNPAEQGSCAECTKARKLREAEQKRADEAEQKAILQQLEEEKEELDVFDSVMKTVEFDTAKESLCTSFGPTLGTTPSNRFRRGLMYHKKTPYASLLIKEWFTQEEQKAFADGNCDLENPKFLACVKKTLMPNGPC